MKTQSLLTTLATVLLAQGAQAGCYSGGDSWPNTEEARSFIEFACYGNGGIFTGNFAPTQTKSMCPRSGGIGLWFQVQNLGTGHADIDNNECYNRLRNEIFGCQHGGESTVNGWRFRADPGNC